MLLISGFFMSTVAKGSDGPEDRRVEKHTLGVEADPRGL
jgi:hypothetical protein